MSDELLLLECIKPGAWVEVAEVCGEPSWVGRMAEMGVRCGSHVRVLQGGSPCLFQIGDSRLSLRGDGVAQILVRPLAG